MLYAMKVIRKSFVLEKNKVEQIMTERRILAHVQHPFIVTLHYSFQTVLLVLANFSAATLSVPHPGLLSLWRAILPAAQSGATARTFGQVLFRRSAAGHRVPPRAERRLSGSESIFDIILH